MSDTFIISNKVIVTACATVFMCVFGIIFKNWVDDERKFKEDVVKELKGINKTLIDFERAEVIQDGRLNEASRVGTENNDDIKAIRKALATINLYPEIQ